MIRATHQGRSPRRAAGLLAGVLAAAVVLTACSTQGDRTTDSAATSGSSATSAAASESAVSESSASESSASPGGSDQPASDTSTDAGSYQPAEPGVPESGPATEGATSSTEAAPTTAEAVPAATTPVAPPAAGDVNQTVADQPVTSLPPVPVTESGDFGTGVTAAVDSLERIDAVGRGPGEISGPALSYRLSITNGTAQDLDLSTISVNVQDATGTPFSPVDNDPAVPFTGSLAPGQTASATYVFTLPTGYTAPATLSLAYSATAPIVLFAGDAQ